MGAKHSSCSKLDNSSSSSSSCLNQKYRPIGKGSQTSTHHVQTQLYMKLNQRLALTEAKDTNMVFCPLLIQMFLSMIAAGSKGPTRQEMLTFLGSESTDDLNQMCLDLATRTFLDGSAAGGPKLSFVNSVWVDKSVCLKQTFKHVLDTIYKAASKQVEFRTKVIEVTQEVNSWVKNNTKGLIKELILHGSIDGNTRLIFTNALYFKGTWTWKFDPSTTIDSNFHLLNGGSLKVPFMTSKADHLISTFNGFKVLRLCYEKGRDSRQFSMYVFLPNARDGLLILLQKLNSQPDFLDHHIPQVHVGVRTFMMPKFKISFGFEATKILKQEGLTLPFTDPDLSEMLGQPMNDLRVSRIFHKAFIEINEEGTEAAAASAAVVTMRSLNVPANKVDFVADHPFLFFIRENFSGDVLFVGHVMNPQDKSH